MARHAPRRTGRLGDKLMTPDAYELPNRITVDHIVARFDQAVAAMDRKWGVDRLPGLLPIDPPPHVPADRRDDWRAIPGRYGRAVEELHRAIAADDPAAAETWTARAVQMLGVMDRQCDLAGVTRPSVAVHLVTLDGTEYAIVPEAADEAEAMRMHPGATVLTAMQCAIAVERARGGLGMIGECKRLFPDAEPTFAAASAIAAIPTTEFDEALGDGIPF